MPNPRALITDTGASVNNLEVEFSTGRLERCYLDIREGTREWGPAVARRYVERINIIYSSSTLGDLYQHRPWRFHRLHGRYAGMFALTLTGRYRLIVGQGATESQVVIYEVTNHYDD